jgi:hypothetical protein
LKLLNDFLSSYFGKYEPNVCYEYQPATVNRTIRLLFAPAPIILCIISNLCIYFYPLNNTKVMANNLELQRITTLNEKTINGTTNNGFICVDNDSIDINDLPVGNSVILKANNELMFTTRF